MGIRLMKNPRVWLAIVSAAVVVYAVVGLSGRSSPGPLSAVHGRDAKLTGFNGCAQCHGGWFGSMAEACLSCHEPIERQMEARRGLHGALEPAKANECATCHSEHHGAQFQLVNRQSFAHAGVPDPLQFDHKLIGYEMDGKHLELSCGECHKSANVAVLPEGGQRYTGLDQDCETCHKDPHKPSHVLSCTECHGQKSWKDLAPTDHDDDLPLLGGHAGVSCVTCHKEDSPHALSNSGRERARRRDCTACHESPHAESFIAGVALVERTAVGQSCVVCHEPDHNSFRDERLTVSPALHAASGFALDRPHTKVSCQDCHDSTQPEFQARYPGRTADDCKSCHKDPHGGQFAKGPRKQDCVDCHERTHFDPHAFTVKKHRSARMKLDGAHRDAECNACHKVERPDTPRVFRGAGNFCSNCHKDAHHGFFAKFKQQFKKTKHGRCAH
ncbi:MAG: hypothetical protein OER88_02180, partial [Planctomycetota bacterium]|nr:hypothetical protein [Planctomycetota bacterium]